MYRPRQISAPTVRMTDNKHGMMFPLSKYGHAFVDFAGQSGGTVLDIGAAFGVCTIPALKAGAKVIANDISESELEYLEEHVAPELKEQLTLLPGRFPEEIDLPNESLDAVDASHVLHFLSGPTLLAGCRKMFDWLKPGGKVFVVCFTPYHKFMEKYIPVYESRVQHGDPWPGFIEDSTPYVLKQNILPKQTHLMDDQVLSYCFEQAGFEVEEADIFPCPPNLEPREFFHLDGREWVGLIAKKSAV